MKMLKKLWDGEFSLVKTYWLFYVLMWNLALLPLAVFRQTSQSTQDSYLILGLLLAVIFITYGCVVLVGLWRSANKYGGWWLWANLAKVVALLGVVIVAVSIFGALQTDLMYGGALLLSAVATLALIKFYGTDGYTKNIKIFLACCLLIFLLLVAVLGFNFKVANNTTNWMPLIKILSLNNKDDGVSEGTAYLDFNSITSKNGLKYADVASEIYVDGKFTRTVKLQYELDCSVPKMRILTQTTYSNLISDGLGKKTYENLNYQATEAKRVTDNGGAYTGGWQSYGELYDNSVKYCGNLVDAKEALNKFMCSSSKWGVTILKTVCESR